MTRMDHNEALRLEAAEKYVLGELPQDQRDAYEEHYFDCAECALDIKALATFADTARELAGAERDKARAATEEPVPSFWARLFQPAFAAPAYAMAMALLLIVGYQNIVSLPKAKESASNAAAGAFAASFTAPAAALRGSVAGMRGGDDPDGTAAKETKVVVGPNESFAVEFDFTPARTFERYICQLQDEHGVSLLQTTIAGSATNQSLHPVIPGGVPHPGKYALVFAGDPASSGQFSNENEVLRLPFVVEFRR
jgi:hypothetical protein